MKTLKEKYKLPKKFKDEWVKALRSGKYEQGNGQLYSGGCYCCLGVAGKICGVSQFDMKDLGIFIPEFEDSSFVGSKPSILKKLPKQIIGSTEPDDLQYNELVKRLVEMNDDGKSFKYIASYIERYL